MAGTLRYEGARWRIVCGAYEGLERFAVNELQRMVQARVPYVVEVVDAAGAAESAGERHLIVVGTIASNRLLGDLARRGAIRIPAEPQGYTLAVLASPWRSGGRCAVVAGADTSGVLHGAEDFSAHVLAGLGGDTPRSFRAALDSIPDMSVEERPQVATRGIWTWGYVIYDYRRFFDNMARLRMNSVIIWNDCAPANADEVIAYAHARGVAIIFGFHWGWGGDANLAKPGDRAAIKADVLARYRRDYAHLEIDGIYFQTLTEHSDTALEGRTTAAWAVELVNDTAHALFEERPDLSIKFGLHATSIGGHYGELAALDSRVTVVWEDAGAIPFSYDPTDELAAEPGGQYKEVPHTVDETLRYSERLAALRPASEFALVAKGWTTLSWREEFEHHGPFVLGERGRAFCAARLALRQPRWDYVNALWARNYPAAARVYRGMLDATGGKLAVWGLIEDGLLEERIQPSVALFAETLWNPHRTDAQILAASMSGYYTRE